MFARLSEEARQREEDRPPATAPATAAAAPAPSPHPSTRPAGAAEPNPPANPASAGNGGEVPAGYDGLDAPAYQELRRAQLLPTAEEWKATPSLVRANLTRAAKSLISEKSRAFNAQKQLEQRQGSAPAPAAPPQNPPPGRWADADEPPALDGEDPGQRQPQRPAGAKAPPKLDQLLENLRATYGDEVPDALAAVREQMEAEKQELLASVRNLQVQQAQATFAPQEIAAAEQLTGEWPEFAQLAADDAAAEQIRASASVHYHAALNARKPITWQQAIVRGAHSVYADEFQQSAQRRSAEQRDQTLKRTPERGTTRSANPAKLSGLDRDRAVYEQLSRQQSVA